MEGINLLKAQLAEVKDTAARRIGEYLLERFQNDPVMEEKYATNEITLEKVIGYVRSKRHSSNYGVR